MKRQTQRITKHDKYVLELREKIQHKYDNISLNVKIVGNKRSLGEVDLLARKGKNVDLYEVKCSNRIMKAKKQLQRVKRLLRLENSRSYFYCGSSGLLMTL